MELKGKILSAEQERAAVAQLFAAGDAAAVEGSHSAGRVSVHGGVVESVAAAPAAEKKQLVRSLLLGVCGESDSVALGPKLQSEFTSLFNDFIYRAKSCWAADFEVPPPLGGSRGSDPTSVAAQVPVPGGNGAENGAEETSEAKRARLGVEPQVRV